MPTTHLHEAATDDILYTFPVSVERNPADPDVFAWIVSLSLTFVDRNPKGVAIPSKYLGSVPVDALAEIRENWLDILADRVGA